MGRVVTSICLAQSKWCLSLGRRLKPAKPSLLPLNEAMEPSPPKSSLPRDTDAKLRIYFLPNLLTAGNLFCGFLALTRIVQADINLPEKFNNDIREALFLILLACIFDLFDGRVARMGGYESPFGREFDSLADVISFGVAPAFLVHRIVLREAFPQHPEIGWFIASIYLIC